MTDHATRRELGISSEPLHIVLFGNALSCQSEVLAGALAACAVRRPIVLRIPVIRDSTQVVVRFLNGLEEVTADLLADRISVHLLCLGGRFLDESSFSFALHIHSMRAWATDAFSHIEVLPSQPRGGSTESAMFLVALFSVLKFAPEAIRVAPDLALCMSSQLNEPLLGHVTHVLQAPVPLRHPTPVKRLLVVLPNARQLRVVLHLLGHVSENATATRLELDAITDAITSLVD